MSDIDLEYPLLSDQQVHIHANTIFSDLMKAVNSADSSINPNSPDYVARFRQSARKMLQKLELPRGLGRADWGRVTFVVGEYINNFDTARRPSIGPITGATSEQNLGGDGVDEHGSIDPALLVGDTAHSDSGSATDTATAVDPSNDANNVLASLEEQDNEVPGLMDPAPATAPDQATLRGSVSNFEVQGRSLRESTPTVVTESQYPPPVAATDRPVTRSAINVNSPPAPEISTSATSSSGLTSSFSLNVARDRFAELQIRRQELGMAIRSGSAKYISRVLRQINDIDTSSAETCVQEALILISRQQQALTNQQQSLIIQQQALITQQQALTNAIGSFRDPHVANTPPTSTSNKNLSDLQTPLADRTTSATDKRKNITPPKDDRATKTRKSRRDSDNPGSSDNSHEPKSKDSNQNAASEDTTTESDGENDKSKKRDSRRNNSDARQYATERLKAPLGPAGKWPQGEDWLFVCPDGKDCDKRSGKNLCTDRSVFDFQSRMRHHHGIGPYLVDYEKGEKQAIKKVKGKTDGKIEHESKKMVGFLVTRIDKVAKKWYGKNHLKGDVDFEGDLIYSPKEKRGGGSKTSSKTTAANKTGSKKAASSKTSNKPSFKLIGPAVIPTQTQSGTKDKTSSQNDSDSSDYFEDGPHDKTPRTSASATDAGPATGNDAGEHGGPLLQQIENDAADDDDADGAKKSEDEAIDDEEGIAAEVETEITNDDGTSSDNEGQPYRE